MSTVSIVTITQLSRAKCLANLLEIILSQTYHNIIEWVIVEGSKSQADADQNKKQIMDMTAHTPFKIVYVEYSGNALSDLRNSGNIQCKGDIIVCMDDDDYYPPNRVMHAVKMLEGSPKLIAGCSAAYMYDYYTQSLYKFKPFGPNHSTNNCMAYKRKYLETHSHQSGLTHGEESSFTNRFSEPMVQLSPAKCIIISSHDDNTFDKRPMCIKPSPMLKKIDKDITEYIPDEIFSKMKALFTPPSPSPPL